MLAIAIVMFSLAGLFIVFAAMNFLEKGFLFNNAYIYATEEEREKLNKKPYYIQTGIVMIFIALLFVFEGFNVLLKNNLYFILIIVDAVLAVIFAIVSTALINNKEKKKNEKQG